MKKLPDIYQTESSGAECLHFFVMIQEKQLSKH